MVQRFVAFEDARPDFGLVKLLEVEVELVAIDHPVRFVRLDLQGQIELETIQHKPLKYL